MTTTKLVLVWSEKRKKSNVLYGQETTRFGDGSAEQIGFNVGQISVFRSGKSGGCPGRIESSVDCLIADTRAGPA